MKKQFILILWLAALAGVVHGYCKEVAPGQFESTNSLMLPLTHTLGNAWHSDYWITNISDVDITFFMK